MTAISTAALPRSASSGSVPLLRGLRSGGRAFVREVSAAVPALQDRSSAPQGRAARASSAAAPGPRGRFRAAGRPADERAARVGSAGRVGSVGRSGGSAVAAGPEHDFSAVRLTRRGRLLLIGLPSMLGVLAAAALLIVLAAPSHVVAGTAPAEGPGVESVTVQPGQSMWELAEQSQPQRDTRDVVLQIVELNDLESSQVAPGQQILVPAA